MKKNLICLLLTITIFTTGCYSDKIDEILANKFAAISTKCVVKDIRSLVDSPRSYGVRFAYDNIEKLELSAKIHESFEYDLTTGKPGGTGIVVRPFKSFGPLTMGSSYENVSDYQLITTDQSVYPYSLIMAHYGVKNADGKYSIRTGLGWSYSTSKIQYTEVEKDGKKEKIEREFTREEITMIDQVFVKKAAEEAGALMRKFKLPYNDNNLEFQLGDSKRVLRVKGVKVENVKKLVAQILKDENVEFANNREELMLEVNMIVMSGISDEVLFNYTSKDGQEKVLKFNLISFALGGGDYTVEVYFLR